MKGRNLFNGIILGAFKLNTRKPRHQLILVQRDTRQKFQITINTALNNASRAMLNTCLLKTDSVCLAHHTMDISSQDIGAFNSLKGPILQKTIQDKGFLT